ncbi:MAG: peptidyl-prolyl cis-trans isomerase [Desulfovibrionales bacterium]
MKAKHCWLAGMTLLVSVTLVQAVVTSAAEIVDRIVGMANGEVVTLFELNQRMRPVMQRYQAGDPTPETEAELEKIRREILGKMLDNILIRQEAERMGISVSQVEVDAQIRRIKQERGLAEEEFEDQLRLQGLTREELAEQIRADLLRKRLLSSMVTNKVVVTDEQISDYYQEHQDEFRVDKAVDVSLILLEDTPVTDAATLREDIAQGSTTFEQAARMYSQGPGADQGGHLGTLRWKELGPEWREALSGMSAGEVSEPFSLQGLTALVRLNQVQPGKIKPLEEVSDEIHQRLYAPKVEKQLEKFLQRLRSKAVLDIKL